MVEGLVKHTGYLVSSRRNVVVVFRTLPSEPKFCLVIETGDLPDSYRESIEHTLRTREALSTNDFYDVLHTRTFSDGTNCLTSLHQRGYIRKVPVEDVMMTPLENNQVPLEKINLAIEGRFDDNPSSEFKAQKSLAESGDTRAIGLGLIEQARELEERARALREEAYALDERLVPTIGRPKMSDEERAIREAEKKVRRKEKDRENAEKRRREAESNQLEDRIQAKLARDSMRPESADLPDIN